VSPAPSTSPAAPALPGAAAARKPLTGLGCGCAGLVTVAMVLVVGTSVAVWRADRGFEGMRDDPGTRRAAVARVLPHRELPAGYHPVGAMTMPFGLLRMAVLADVAPGIEPPREHVERAFFFVDMPDWFGREEKMREVFRGGAEPAGGIRQSEVEFEAREELGRGELAAGGAAVLWYSRRGTLKVDDSRFGLAEEGAPLHEMAGIATMLLFDCAGDDRLRLGLWFAPDPAPELPAAETDLGGTPGDPEAIRAFLGGLRLCG
jgi:hypothetical protein